MKKCRPIPPTPLPPAPSASRSRGSPPPTAGGRAPHPPATSRSRSTASSATCAPSRWSAPTAPSTGTARRGSTPRRCSAALLDARKGGYFSLSSRSTARPKQLYLPDTNILLTRFLGAEAVGEVIDFMVPETSETAKARDLLVRQARAVRGRATFELACHPAFDYGRAPHTVELVHRRRGGLRVGAGPLRAAHDRAAEERRAAAWSPPSPSRRARPSTSSWSGTASCGRSHPARPTSCSPVPPTSGSGG